MSQTYQNFECLLINDGSPDNSADICREYAEKDSRFKYFVKEMVDYQMHVIME